MKKSRISILIATFAIGFLYQPNWIYQNFYYNPKWVDNSNWAPNYLIYLLIYACLSTLLIDTVIRFSKKYLQIVNNISYVGVILVIAVIFLFLKWSSGLQAKEDGTPRETNTRLMWIAIITVLALLGLFVLSGDFSGSDYQNE